MKLYEINSVGSILDDFAIFRACLWVLSFVAEPYLEVKKPKGPSINDVTPRGEGGGIPKGDMR